MRTRPPCDWQRRRRIAATALEYTFLLAFCASLMVGLTGSCGANVMRPIRAFAGITTGDMLLPRP